MSVPTSGEYKIVIEFNGEGGDDIGETTPSPVSPAPIEDTKETPIGGQNSQVKLAMAVNVAKNIGMQGLNAAVSNIGLATGNYYAQQKTQRAISGAQSLVGLAMSFTNPYTAVAAVAGLTISGVSEMYQQNREREIANFQSEQYAKRLGYTRDRR